MDALMMVWINTLVILFAVSVLAVVVYRVEQTARQIAEALSRVERISQATLDLVFRQSQGSRV
jgi:hypothetical protein